MGIPACSHDLAVLHVEGGSSPAVVVELSREEVVERHSDSGILQSELGQTEVVRQVEIGGEVAVEHHAHIYGLVVVVECLIALKTCVGHVLLTDVAALYRSLKTTIVEGQDIVQQEVGRESQRLVA